MTDHYQTLGVDRTATQDEIKKAYRKLASQHHPDRGGDTKKFQEIQVAYDTISDPAKRAEYDNPSPFGTNSDGSWREAGFPPGFEDIFSQMMSGRGGNPFGFNFRNSAPQRNRTLNIQTTITLEEAFNGKDLIAGLKLPSGRDQTIEVKIPRGIQDGTTLRLTGMGDDSVPNQPKGDIHLTINVQQHEQYQRNGDDLVASIEVNAIDAILGKVIRVTTIDRKTLEVTINPGTQHGQVYSATGYGMPNMRDPRFVGRLLLGINIKIPTDLTEAQLAKVRDIYN